MIKIKQLLTELNPEFLHLFPFIQDKINHLNEQLVATPETRLFSEKDTVLISYADQFTNGTDAPLKLLDQFLQNDLKNSVSHVHILPFYPWTSDDGFAPVNYHEVSPEYGQWNDIKNMKSDKMFDCVFNHLSSKNLDFQAALSGDVKKEKYFHIYEDEEFNTPKFQEDLQNIVRPRTTPLMTPFEFNGVKKHVWTTFGPDQVDTNLNHPEVLKYVLDCLFLYIEQGAKYFRIDAVPFMWKELGTNCSHLPKTHKLIQLFRAIVDEVNGSLIIITESNVPQHENITYWGNGNNEAHMIYNFSLAPLILHAITFKTNEFIHSWAENVFDIHPETTYLNFTATHDGIGMRGLEGLVPEEDIAEICRLTEVRGGFVGKKRSRDGSIKPYELNSTWAHFLNTSDIDENSPLYIRKVVHSHAVAMFFPGVAAHYVHNFFGLQNWQEGYKQSGIPRRMNRRKLSYPIPHTETSQQIMGQLIEWIEFKTQHRAFSPQASIEVLHTHPQVLSFIRCYAEEKFYILFNLSEKDIELKINDKTIHLQGYDLKVDAL